MPRTVAEYHNRWREALKPGSAISLWNDELLPTATIIYESAHSTFMGEGCGYFADFGDAICFYRFMRVPEELTPAAAEHDALDAVGQDLPGFAMMTRSWDAYRAQFSDEEIARRRERADRELDALLARYVADGYQVDMSDRLIAIVNETLIDFELHEVFVLPGDLPRLLEEFGNPLVDAEDDETIAGEDSWRASAAAEPFDLDNPAHRSALANMIDMIGS